MVDLTEISGIPIKFNEETLCIELGEAIRCNSEVHVSIDEINPVLLNKSVKYPEKVYRHYSDILGHDFKGNFKYRYDIFVIPYGLLGIEYVKTHIFYEDPSDEKYDCVIEVLSGTLTVILQKNLESDEEDFWVDVEVEKVYIVDLDVGEQMVIPTGYYYTFVNTSSKPVVFSKIRCKSKKQLDYATIQRERGLAFYLISKNARVEIVPNPKYKIKFPANYLKHKKLLKEKDFFLEELHRERKPLFHHFSEKREWIANWIHSHL